MSLRSFSTLIGIIFLMVLSTTMLLSASSVNISGIQAKLAKNQTYIVEQNLESCKEELLRHLKDELSYQTERITLPNGATCAINIIITSPEEKIVTVTATNGNATKSQTLTLAISTLLSAINIKITNITTSP